MVSLVKMGFLPIYTICLTLALYIFLKKIYTLLIHSYIYSLSVCVYVCVCTGTHVSEHELLCLFEFIGPSRVKPEVWPVGVEGKRQSLFRSNFRSLIEPRKQLQGDGVKGMCGGERREEGMSPA